MKCILVFDHLNDVVYTKYNKKFANHINEFAKKQKLEESKDAKLSVNLIVQIFSPIVTSQRIMSCQFGNSYTSIQCGHGINMTFEDYMGFLFVCIGVEDVNILKRNLNIVVTLVRYLCGPNIQQIKVNPQLARLLSNLIDAWLHLQSTDQAMNVEAIEQLMVNSDTSTSALKSLKEAIAKLKAHSDYNKVHALIIIENKLLALYSSENANELNPSDILFLSLLCQAGNKKADTESDEEEFFSPCSSPQRESSNLMEIFQPEIVDTRKYQLLLNHPKCLPHAVHIKDLGNGISLIFSIETCPLQISAHLYDAFAHLHTLQAVQIQGEVETLRPPFERLDATFKKLLDGLKRTKNNAIESAYKDLSKKWDFMRKKYLEFIKSYAMDALLRAESLTSNLLESLCEVLSLTAFDQTLLKSSQCFVQEVANGVADRLANYAEFLRVKALRNFPPGSCCGDSLTINKYLEEFPGLVHFIYVDRTTHRLTAPTLEFNSEMTNILTKNKIWKMVAFSATHLQEGHLSLMWKDTTFNYGYFLWFEDMTGSPLKPAVFPTNKVLPQPGILCGDFYQKLRETCFPKMPASKIRCYELFCIHLGLATSTCVLEHTRRLAATIWELKGHPNHPIDLL